MKWQGRIGIIFLDVFGTCTHRCYKKEFLLKFARERRRWLQWLFEAKKRYGLSVLDYMVTSNYIHLLIRDNGERDVSPNSIQLIAGRTGQELKPAGNALAYAVQTKYLADCAHCQEVTRTTCL
jgi:putative transposase